MSTAWATRGCPSTSQVTSERALKEAGARYRSEVYEGARHGSMADQPVYRVRRTQDCHPPADDTADAMVKYSS